METARKRNKIRLKCVSFISSPLFASTPQPDTSHISIDLIFLSKFHFHSVQFSLFNARLEASGTMRRCLAAAGHGGEKFLSRVSLPTRRRSRRAQSREKKSVCSLPRPTHRKFPSSSMLDSTICIRFRGARGGRKFKQATSVARSPLVSAQLVDSMRFAYNKKAAKLPSERSTENSFRKNESFYG